MEDVFLCSSCLIAGVLVGSFTSSYNAEERFKGWTKVNYESAVQMKANCEADLPRNRFCTTELIVREDKE